MAKNIDFMGAVFPDVPSVKLPQQGGGLVAFDDTTDATATADKILSGYTAYANGQKLTGTASGGGGGGIGTLLTEESLGHVSVTGSYEASVGTVSFTSDTDYDMYIAVISRSEVQGGYHYATVSMNLRLGTSNRAAEGPGVTSYSITSRWNCIANSNGTIKTAQSGKGLYIGNFVRQGTENTAAIYGQYKSSGTGTIDGEYSIQIYGINLYGLVG